MIWANSYLDKKEFNKALEYYGRISIDPSKAGLWVNKGIAYHKLSNNLEALKCFEIAIALDPTNPDALRFKGTTLFNLEKYEDALQIFQMSIDLGHADENDWFGKGMCLQKLGKSDEALTCMNKSIEINPKANFAMTYKGEILNGQSKFEEALYWQDEALKVDATLPVPWYHKGLILQKINRIEEANYCYDKSIEYFENYPITPGIHFLWNCKGNCLADLGRHNEALEWYNKALVNSPQNGVYLTNKALTLLNLKRLDESIECAEYAMKLDSSSEEVIKNGTNLMMCIGSYLCILDKYDEAIKCFERLCKLDNKNERALSFKTMTINNPKEMKKIALNDMIELPWFHKSDFNIDWSEVLEKKVLGTDNYDFGVVSEIETDQIVTRRGMVVKDRFYLPKKLVERYDGHKLWFNITKDDAHRYKKCNSKI